MKNLFVFISILAFTASLWSQDNYLIAITRVKTKDGCGDYNYELLKVKDGKEFAEKSELLKKEHSAVGGYKDYYLPSNEFGVLVKFTGQHFNGSCTFLRYDFVRNRKTLQGARDFVQKQYTDFRGLYASQPVEFWNNIEYPNQ